ncbi:hypothetical protein [Serratia fonticola]|uniref:hypothetical protein n=1 Tax=Serratia fonticola TaxID=47917 RepID=UPI00217CA710|nr:hypothetical protein [Serratia fonticola]CAI1213360.1 Uncharacterised protein [Serratia fonticola]CAI1219498.1 Uncharacterised protein [Serratia fonticola]
MNTHGTSERRDDLGALLSYRRAVNALAWPAAVFDLAIRHQTLANGPKPALLRGLAELAWQSRASVVGLTTQQRWGAVGG